MISNAYVIYIIEFSIVVHISSVEEFPIIVISKKVSSVSIEDVAMHFKYFK